MNPADSPILILAAHSDTLPLTTVDDFADTVVAQQISQITGVAQVIIGGEQKPAVRVQVDPAKLQTRGLTLEDVRGVLAVANSDASKGSINGVRQSFTIAANDQLVKAQDYDNVIIAYRNGAPIRVRDVGQAVAGPQDVNIAALSGDKPAVILLVFKQPGANVIDTVDQIKAAMPGLAAVIPPGMHLDTIVDRTQTIRASVQDVEFTLMLTICLVVMVILVFLRNFWATLIPSVTVPLALLGATAVMYLLGFSLDNLSLMALTLAVGFVVDDAIVVVENIYRHVEEGTSAMQAALKGASEIGFTVVSISISLIAVFIPLLLMGGIIGRLFREFALTVTAAIIVSVVVSLTLTPMLCSRFLRKQSDQHGRVFRAIEWGFETLIGGYRRMLDVVLRHQPLTLMVFLATMAVTAVLFVTIPKGFFPIQDTGLIQGLSEAAQDVSPDRDETPAARAVASDRARSRRRLVRLLLRQRRRQYAQHRPLLHRAQAARRAHVLGAAGDQSAAAATRQGAKAPICSCSRRRTSPWGARSRAASSNIPCRTPTSRSSTPGRPACSPSSRRCPSSPTSPPTSRATPPSCR